MIGLGIVTVPHFVQMNARTRTVDNAAFIGTASGAAEDAFICLVGNAFAGYHGSVATISFGLENSSLRIWYLAVMHRRTRCAASSLAAYNVTSKGPVVK